MKRIGVIGLGDMGSGLAKNLIAGGFETVGLDLSPERMAAFRDLGGIPADSAAKVGAGADAVFVMVMNGDQAKAVILGDGLVSTMAPGSAVVLSATIKPHEAREIGAALEGSGLHLIDTPVSGGSFRKPRCPPEISFSPSSSVPEPASTSRSARCREWPSGRSTPSRIRRRESWKKAFRR